MVSFSALFVGVLLSQAKGAIGYAVDASKTSLTLKDSRTNTIAHTLFLDEAVEAIVDGLRWESATNAEDTTGILNYRTFVNGQKLNQGFVSLPENPLDLPTSVNAGTIFAQDGGKTIISVEFWIDDSMDSVSTEVQAIKKWLAAFPMIIIVLIGTASNFHVIYNLLIGLFVGGYIVTGSFIDGFKSIITTYIIDAASDTQHVYTFMFTICVAGFVAMLRKSGGIAAVAKHVGGFSKSLKIGQIIVFGAGIALFFDSNASILFIGELLSPFFRLFPISIEKFAFLIDSTAVPVAALNPFSTWVGINSALIQTQIDQIIELGNDDLTITIPDDGWTVYLHSLKYQFYPIFVLCFAPILIIARRDLGHMLIAERRRWLFTQTGQLTRWSLREKISRPDEGTPRRERNMWLPVLILGASIWTAFGLVSDADDEDNAIDFSAALIYCTIGAAALTQILFILQNKQNGEIGFSPIHFFTNLCSEPEDDDGIRANRSVDSVLRRLKPRDEADHMSAAIRSRLENDSRNADFILQNLEALSSVDTEMESKLDTLEPPTDRNEHIKLMQRAAANIEDIEARFTPNALLNVAGVADEDTVVRREDPKALVSLKEGAECFFKGGATVTPMLITLTLAWATTELFLELGLDRLFVDLINRGNVQIEMYPTVSFLVSLILTLATGSSTAATAMILPLVAIPTYVGSGGNAELFYAMIGAVFSGAVVGDHASPIAESTILSSFTIECDLKNHIKTQSPYIIFITLLSLAVGTIPSAFELYPYFVAYPLGLFVMGVFILVVCQDVLHAEGKYDFVTESYLSRVIDHDLHDLKTQMRMAHGIMMAQKGYKETDVINDTDSVSHIESEEQEEEASTISSHSSSASTSSSGSANTSYDGETYNDDDDGAWETNYASPREIRSMSKSLEKEASLDDESACQVQRSQSQRNRLNGSPSITNKRMTPTAETRTTKRTPISPREVIEDHSFQVTKSVMRPPGLSQMISRGEGREMTENDTATGLSMDDGTDLDDKTYNTGRTDLDEKSYHTGLQTRVLRWLGQAVDDDDGDYDGDETRDHHTYQTRDTDTLGSKASGTRGRSRKERTQQSFFY